MDAKNLIKSKFARSVAVLAGGTALAQVITILCLPILTRLYGPDDFAVLAVFSSLTGIFSVVGCARLEMALPIPQKDIDSAALLLMALSISLGFSIILFLLLYFGYDLIEVYVAKSEIGYYILLVPLAVWLTSSSLALQYWLTRKKRFGIVSQAKISRSASGSAIQMGAGWYGIGVVGLLLGHIVISGAGGVRQIFNILSNDLHLLKAVSIKKIKRIYIEYRMFSLYSSLGALANSSNSHLPVLLIAIYAVGPEAGYLILATRLMSAPLSLVGSAISQVFVSRAPAAYREGSLEVLTAKTLRGVIKVAVGPLIMIGIVAPRAIPFLFGEEWKRAGEVVAYMTPWIVMQLLSTPVATVLQITRNERVAFFLQVAGLCIRLGAVILAIKLSPSFIVEAFLISGFVFYLIYLIVIVKVSGIKKAILYEVIKWFFLVIGSASLLAFSLDVSIAYFVHG